MIYRYTFSFLVLILFLGCKTETKETTNTLCDNQNYLLAPNKDLPTFNFDLNINPKEHIEVLKDSFKIDNLCDKFTKFNYSINDQIIELSIIPFCEFLGQHFTREIELNFSNQILIFHELSSLENIKEKLVRDFPFEKNELNIIDITWEYGLSESSINKVIYQLIEGYLEALEPFSVKDFNKPICGLNLEEVKTLKTKYPLTLDLKNISHQISENYNQQKMLNSN